MRLLPEKQAIHLAIGNGDDRWEANIIAAAHRLSSM